MKLTISGCSGPLSTQVPFLEYDDESQKLEVWNNPYIISEASPEHTHAEAAAQLIMKTDNDPNKLKFCSSSLISEDIVMTNSHCVDSFKAQFDCGDIKAVFPEFNGKKQEEALCAQIIDYSFYNDKKLVNTTDYAFIRLNRKITTRSPLKMNKNGFPNNFRYYTYSFDPVTTAKSNHTGTFKVKECYSSHGGSSSPNFVHSLYQTFKGLNCLIIKGNSGSPAVDHRGEVRGIIHAIKPDTDISYGTNLACINTPFDRYDSYIDPDCFEEVDTQ